MLDVDIMPKTLDGDRALTQEKLSLPVLIQEQKKYFLSGATRDFHFRIKQLSMLKKAIQLREALLLEALYKDLRKHEVEAFACEIGIIYAEIEELIKHLKKWMKPRRVRTPILSGLARSFIISEPLGSSLILGTWNYPFQLCISPLIGAIAAGNVVILKPSEVAPHTAVLLALIINSSFPPQYIHVVNGGAEMSQQLLEMRWDHIFFTGSTSIGKIVAAAAAKHLTPCTLELGGKSPCIVTKHAKIRVAAARIVFGKLLNSGQTCVAPDYILVDESVHDALVEAIKMEIIQRYGQDLLANPQIPKIVNLRHFERLRQLIDPGKVVFGGRVDASQQLIEPTLMTRVTLEDRVMQDEIFGPILPIISVKNLDEAKTFVLNFEKPLALYIFSEDKAEQADVMDSLSFGGACINDTLMHLTNSNLPFGGVGASGTGSYHGKHSFVTFSHQKAVLSTFTFIDLPFRYAPWTKMKDRLFRWLLS